MKKSLIAILLIATLILTMRYNSADTKQKNKITGVTQKENSKMYICSYRGQERSFLLHIPEEQNENMPLLFMLHAYAGNPESFSRDTGMNKTADEYGYAVVYPQGIQDPNDKTSGAGWNSGLKEDGNDDTGFLVALAKYLQDTYGFNREATFAAGFSNGAFMMYRLAVEAPETFCAVSSVAGFMTGNMWDKKSETASVGILQINGTKDDVIPFEEDGKNNTTGSNPTINEVIEYWKNANNLEQSKEEELSKKATAITYYSDTNTNRVCYIEIKDGSHSWPQESFAGFNTNEVILDFFENCR